MIAGSGFDGATGNYELTIERDRPGPLRRRPHGPLVRSRGRRGPRQLSAGDPPGDERPARSRHHRAGTDRPALLRHRRHARRRRRQSGRAGLGQFLVHGRRAPALPPGAPGARQLCGAASPAIRARASPCWPIPGRRPLGEDAAHPAGADESFSFQVDGIDGVAGATSSDDTAATAQQLGDVAGAGLIQVSGAIGVDPSFNPSLVTRPDQSRAAVRSPPTRSTSITSRSPGPGDTRCSPRSSRAGSARRWTPGSACTSSIRATAARLPRRQQQHARPHPGHRRVGPACSPTRR